MGKGILGLKIGMTSIYEGDKFTPVTVIQAGPCVVIDKKTIDKDGYSAIKVGFYEINDKKLKKPLQGIFKKKNVPPFKFVREFRDMEGEVGDTITVDLFRNTKIVKVTGVSKGKGYQGVVKRWGFGGWPKSHGSEATRRPGSIGQRATPGRVFKGMKMAGHLGTENITIRNLEIVKIIPEKNLILIKGSVPGVDKGLLIIRE